MDRKWFRRIGLTRMTAAGAVSRSSKRRRRWKSPELVIQELERRTLLSVTAFFNPANSTELEVDLSAVGDQAQIMPSGKPLGLGALTVVVLGTNYSGPSSFPGVMQIVVDNTSTLVDANQAVTFQQSSSSSTFALDAASGTDALLVDGIASVTFTDVTVEATSGDVDVAASETTSVTGVLGTTKPQVSVGVTGANIKADNITLDASATSSYTYSDPFGGVLNSLGVAAAIADIEPSATVTVGGSSSVEANGTDGNVTIGADTSVTVNATAKVDTVFGGSALNPVAAAIAFSVVNSSAVADVGGGSTVMPAPALAL